MRQVFSSFRSGLRLAVLSAAVLASSFALASSDHDHGSGGPDASVQLLPRGEGRAEGIEAVAVASGDRRLVVYLDREATNEPVTGAIVEVDADGWLLKLRETEGGIYVADEWVASPGRNRLMIAYRLSEGAGKIEVQVDAPQARSIAAPLPASTRFEEANMAFVAAAAGALYLLVMALFIWRARRAGTRPQPSAVLAAPRVLPALPDRERIAAD
jgi:cobalt-zinc-cadmium efflux system membrane fusion protein